VLVLGKSIGGGSEMQDLDEKNTLVEKVKEMAGSRVVSAERRTAQAPAEMRKKRRSMRA
jgi:hypothetical protein